MKLTRVVVVMLMGLILINGYASAEDVDVVVSEDVSAPAASPELSTDSDSVIDSPSEEVGDLDGVVANDEPSAESESLQEPSLSTEVTDQAMVEHVSKRSGKPKTYFTDSFGEACASMSPGSTRVADAYYAECEEMGAPTFSKLDDPKFADEVLTNCQAERILCSTDVKTAFGIRMSGEFASDPLLNELIDSCSRAWACSDAGAIPSAFPYYDWSNRGKGKLRYISYYDLLYSPFLDPLFPPQTEIPTEQP